MSPLISRPSHSNAFSSYRPSTNAHTDFLKPESSTKRSIGRTFRLQLPVQPQPNLENTLNTLTSSISALLAGQSTPLTYHSIFSTCQSIALRQDDVAYRQLGSDVNSAYTKEIGKSAMAIAVRLKRRLMARDEMADILKDLVESWQIWNERTMLLRSLFIYADRVRQDTRQDSKTWQEEASDAFVNSVWKEEAATSAVENGIGQWLEYERINRVSSDLRPTTIRLTELARLSDQLGDIATQVSLNVERYLSTTAAGFLSASKEGQKNASNLVSWLLEQTEMECARAKDCISDDLAGKITLIAQVVSKDCVTGEVVRQALDEAMDQGDVAALERLCRVVTQAGIFDRLVDALAKHLEARTKTLISDPANDPQMIDQILKLKRFVGKCIKDLFPPEAPAADEDTEMLSLDEKKEQDLAARKAQFLLRTNRTNQFNLCEAVRTGFKLGLSSRQNAPAEWIAKYLDTAMRKGQGTRSEAEFEQYLEEIIELIGSTKDKDVFRAFYSQGLAKRLLMGRSASDDMEKNMIAKLQKELGEEFTTGDVMMKDLQLSETLVKSYQQSQSRIPASSSQLPFTANVLTESAWPAYPLLKDGWSFRITPSLQSSIDAFTEWYTSQHKNRVLSWRWQLATVTLTARFASGRYEVGVSLFQAVVLLQYNDVDSMTFGEIKERTGIEQQELVRTLQSLALGRKGTRVLMKKPAGKDVTPTDVFAWNKGFTGDKIKFKINQIQQGLTAEESRKTNEQVHLDRVAILEATIVRIMKGRKKMTLQLLIDAVVVEVSKRFPPDVKDIKKRVESLIEREFMSRDEEDRGLLHYVA